MKTLTINLPEMVDLDDKEASIQFLIYYFNINDLT